MTLKLLLPSPLDTVILSPSEKPKSNQVPEKSVSTNLISQPLEVELSTFTLLLGTGGVALLFSALAVNLLPNEIAEIVRVTLLTFASVVSAIFPTDNNLPAT